MALWDIKRRNHSLTCHAGRAGTYGRFRALLRDALSHILSCFREVAFDLSCF